MFKYVFTAVAVLAALVVGSAGAATTRLTTASSFDGESVFSPDGTKIAFASERRPSSRDAFVMNRDGSAQLNVSCPAFVSSCADNAAIPFVVGAGWPQWTPDGSKVVFESSNGIQVAHADGSGSSVIYSDTARLPHSLVDGRIVFLGSMGIGVVNQDGSGLGTLVDGDGYPLNGATGATTVAYTSRADGSLHVIGADGTNDTHVTDVPALYPAASPDGTRVAFVRYDAASATYDLFVINRDGSGLTQLTNDAYIENETMSWSPNGRQIAFYRSTSPDGTANDVVVANVDGNGTQTFGTGFSDDAYPRFAPDGNAITFTSDLAEPGNYDVYSGDVADLEQVTASPGGSVSTETAAGPNARDPVQTRVTTPFAGDVEIREIGTNVVAPSGYAFGDQQVEITAPSATVLTPLQLRFGLAASALPTGATAATLTVFRDGTAVAACTAAGVATPDPCISSRVALAGGGAEVTVLSSHASTWNFGVRSGFDFDGFFAPVDNLPSLNVATAGSAIPVKFSLHGDQGLAIFASGYPATHAISCDPAAPQTPVEETVASTTKPLSYDASSDRYTFVWKTDKAWAGTCRQLVVGLTDGSFHRANFKLK